MIAFGHTAVGAGVGLLGYHLFQNDPLPIGLVATGTMGVVSHYLADLVPHGHFFRVNEFNQKIYLAAFFDFIASVVIFATVAALRFGIGAQFWFILFGIGGSQLPDVIDSLMRLKKLPQSGFLKKEYEFHQSTHWHGREENALMLGVRDIWQVATVILVLALILR